MSNPMYKVLERMRQGSVTSGWGAVAVYSRERLNRLLEQQYNQRLSENRFLAPFSVDLTSNAPQRSHLALHALQFGTPRLEFTNASLTDSKARLTMNIVAGTCTTTDYATAKLLSSFTITESMGYQVTMDVDLQQVTGQVDRRGRVTLDLSRSAQLMCNLLAEQPALNQGLSAQLQTWFNALPAHVGTFELGMVDFDGYHPLTPTRFIIRTQAAPGAKVLGSLNAGDGAVLVFMRLRANRADGVAPGRDFPYLIPDGNYSATLVLNEQLVRQADNDRLDVLSRLLFPATHAFQERSRETPHDLAVFGNIDPLISTMSIVPNNPAISAGQQVQLRMVDGRGDTVAASNWKVLGLHSHSPASAGSIDAAGLYTAPSREQLDRDTQVVVVSATYQQGNDTYSASARLLVSFEAMEITPRVASRQAGTRQIDLAAWSSGQGPVDWTLLGTPVGELATTGDGTAVFVPQWREDGHSVSVQEVQASNGEQGISSLVLLNGQSLLDLEPAYVPHVAKAGSTQLTPPTNLLPDAQHHWRVLSGPGTVDQQGLFSAAAQDKTQSSVVACELIQNGVIYADGYSVLKQSEQQQEQSWKTLQKFTIKVRGGADRGMRGSLYANGYQQLTVDIEVVTVEVGGKNYPLSVTEVASLGLYYQRSRQKVASLSEDQVGIEAGDPMHWATRLTRNRFDLAVTQGMAPASEEERTVRQTFYLHSLLSEVETFYVGFQADSGEWFYSNQMSGAEFGTISVSGLAVPHAQDADYTFQRRRVEGGGSGNDELDDDFDFHLRTVDYWALKYNHSKFVSCRFIPGDDGLDGQSMMRWESDHFQEIMCSFSGYIFQDALRPQVQTVQFDVGVTDLLSSAQANYLAKPVDQSAFEPGALVITNHRYDDIEHVEEDDKRRKALPYDLTVELRDTRGNPHYRKITYRDRTTVGDRNRMRHSSFTPRPVEAVSDTPVGIRLNDKNLSEVE